MDAPYFNTAWCGWGFKYRTTYKVCIKVLNAKSRIIPTNRVAKVLAWDLPKLDAVVSASAPRRGAIQVPNINRR